MVLAIFLGGALLASGVWLIVPLCTALWCKRRGRPLPFWARAPVQISAVAVLTVTFLPGFAALSLMLFPPLLLVMLLYWVNKAGAANPDLILAATLGAALGAALALRLVRKLDPVARRSRALAIWVLLGGGGALLCATAVAEVKLRVLAAQQGLTCLSTRPLPLQLGASLRDIPHPAHALALRSRTPVLWSYSWGGFVAYGDPVPPADVAACRFRPPG